LMFDNLTTDAKIKIFTLSGELVRTVDYKSADGRTPWDGKNIKGEYVASGVYIAFIDSGKSTKSVKIAVIK